ncbi:DUF4253 domain-containing protein [Asanoa hainanensis]|uniref:DUF4253 domain-containing protein n=1 Tax=Asanoa hainanensis TaxID=560556 RepID=UPI00117C8718|nr:DUF4253 domain-containing protein [Asanoa hainanensis]
MARVMDDPDEIAAVFRRGALDGLPVEEGLGDTWVVTGVESSQLLPAWRAARAAVARTGRWPVLTMADEQWLDAETEQVDALDYAARAVDPWTVYRWSGHDSQIEPADLRLWLPGFLSEAQVVLLPTSTQWLAPAWLNYFGATEKHPGREGLAAAIRQWERQWGAELVASWGTMLQFVVARQPALGEQAWQLALQLLAVGGSLQAPSWELALAVTRSDAWFLHDRP